MFTIEKDCSEKHRILGILAGLATIMLLLLNLFGCESNANAGKTDLRHPIEGRVIHWEYQVFEEYIIPEEGLYLILFSQQLVNNIHSNVMVVGALRLNGYTLTRHGYNISEAAHYGIMPLHWGGYFLKGDVIQVMLRADCGDGFPKGAAFVEEKSVSFTICKLNNGFIEQNPK